MKELHIIARCAIHDGHLEEFKTLAEQCLVGTREKDSGTLQYDWYFNEDETECVVHGVFKDSDALVLHRKNVAEAVDELLKICDLSTEMYGDPSSTLVKDVDGLGVVYYRHHLGL